MKNINVYLRENLSAISTKSISIAPNIEEKKLNNAVKAFGYTGSPNNIVALLDNTLFGSGKDGLIFTGEQLIYRPSFADPMSVNYCSIVKVERVEKLTGRNNCKQELSVEVTIQNGSKITIKNLLDCHYTKLAEILKTIISNFEEYKEEKQLVPIDEMRESVKIAYVKIVINMAYDNDDKIDEKEFAEILLLMTRLYLKPESRFSLRSYMVSKEELNPLKQLISQLDTECPDGQIKSLHISITKDLINIYFCTGGSSIQKFGYFLKNRQEFKVNDAEVSLIEMAIQNDHNMLKDDVTDDQIVSALKVLSAKAAAVGTPLAAVYLSGSVVGMSAAGMTSGLATLGMGGILGLSSMATGIGVAVLLGVGVYTGVRKLTGANEQAQSKRRELMLIEVIKQTQSTISLLIQDINFITIKLNGCIESHDKIDDQVKKLMRLMNQMAGAGNILTQKANSVQGSVIKQSCAQFLDENKLKSLTREPTKIEFYDFIRKFYEERDFTQEKDGQKHEVTKLAIKKDQTNRDLANLSKAFEAIGYFNVNDVVKGAALDVADKAKNNVLDVTAKAKDKLTGLFS